MDGKGFGSEKTDMSIALWEMATRGVDEVPETRKGERNPASSAACHDCGFDALGKTCTCTSL